jgi:hypothetical protein
MFQNHNAPDNAALLLWNAFSAPVLLESDLLLFSCGTCETQTGTNNQVVEAFVTHVEYRSQSAPTLSAAGVVLCSTRRLMRRAIRLYFL